MESFAGTGFFIDPAGTLYTAYSVGGGRRQPHGRVRRQELSGPRQCMADRAQRDRHAEGRYRDARPARSANPSNSKWPRPLSRSAFRSIFRETPSFGMIAGFDRKFLGRYFSTTHLRVNLPTQRGRSRRAVAELQRRSRRHSREQHREWFGLLRAADRCRGENSERLRSLRRSAARLDRHQCRRGSETGGRLAGRDDRDHGGHAGLGSGVKPGDILLQVGKTKVREPEDVIDASFFITAGDTVPITVLRGDEKLTFEVEADFHPGESSAATGRAGHESRRFRCGSMRPAGRRNR